MTQPRPNDCERTQTAQDIREMRKELISIHHEVASTLKMLNSLLDSVQVLGQREAGLLHDIEHLSEDVEKLAPPPAARHCPTCGSALVRHAAMAGDLLICAACGWSQFIDREAGALAPSTPLAAPGIARAETAPWVK